MVNSYGECVMGRTPYGVTFGGCQGNAPSPVNGAGGREGVCVRILSNGGRIPCPNCATSSRMIETYRLTGQGGGEQTTRVPTREHVA